jgi:ubiquinone/menaquinone biosynthesis C-methylase UbiE
MSSTDILRIGQCQPALTFRDALELAGLMPREHRCSLEFENALRVYFASYNYCDHPRFAEWWDDHCRRRVAHALTVFCPWAQRELRDANVLEIGCGTGSSTLALSLHVRKITACDIHAPSLAVARIRLAELGLQDRAELILIDNSFSTLKTMDASFDVVALYAVIEHMLPDERALLFDAVWPLLKPGGTVLIYETPNRLAWRDRHTTFLLGWGWFPPPLALRYGIARGKLPKDCTTERMYREGFGTSYWELKRLLRGKAYSIDAPYVRRPLVRRAFAKLARICLSAPHWAFNETFALKIRKH